MRNKHNGGFSLIEVLVAIVLLGLIVIPISSSMLVAHRINAKTEALLQAELAVSSAAEIANAKGINYVDSSIFDITEDLGDTRYRIITSKEYNEVSARVYVGVTP